MGAPSDGLNVTLDLKPTPQFNYQGVGEEEVDR